MGEGKKKMKWGKYNGKSKEGVDKEDKSKIQRLK